MKTSTEDMKRLGRLTRRSQFLSVQQKGKKWISRGLILQAASNDCSQPRFGLTVSKKVSGSAVVRNRIRRRLRSAAYDILPFQAIPDFDYVLIGRLETMDCPYADLVKDLSWCLKRLGCARTDDVA